MLDQLSTLRPLGLDSSPLLDTLEPHRDRGITVQNERPITVIPEITSHTIHNFPLQCGRILDVARAGWCVYATENGSPINFSKFEHPEVELGRKVIVVLPALTGSARAKVPDGVECSQGDGWANHWIDSQARRNQEASRSNRAPSHAFLDSDSYTIIVVDHLGGNGAPSSTTSAQELFARGLAADITLKDGVELTARALRERGLTEIHAVIGGSIGGGQALNWMFQNQLPVRHIVDISGSTCQDIKAREFFRIQRDLLSDNPDLLRIRTRLSSNMSDLLETEKLRSTDVARIITEGEELTPFQYVVRLVDNELASFNGETPLKNRLECARRLGFLLFVPPDFYQEKVERYYEQSGPLEGRIRLDQWFERQGTDFSGRFSSEALWTLCNMISESEMITAAQIAAQIIKTGTNLTGSAVAGDTLFTVQNNRSLYSAIQDYLNASGDPAAATRLMRVETSDRVNGHDSFFNEKSFAPLGELIRHRLMVI